MKHRATGRISSADKLTVSYKSPGLFPGATSTDVSDVIILTDPSFNVTGWNPPAEKMFGRSVDEAKGRLLFEIIDINFPGTTLHNLLKILHTNSFWNGEVVYDRFDNERFFLNTSAIVLYSDMNIVSGCLFVAKTVSENSVHEKRLIETELKYETVIDTLFEGVVMINAEGKVTACNNRAAGIFGLSQNELIGREIASPSWKAIKEDGSVFPLSEFPVMVTLQTGILQKSITMGIEKPDGEQIWMLVNSQAIYNDEKVEAVVASFNDITAIKHANDRTKESEALFRTFMNNSTAYAWICDEDGNLIYFNSLFGHAHHLKEGDQIKHIREVFSEQIADKFLRNNKKFIETGEPSIITTEAVRADGTLGKFAVNRFNIPVKSLNRLIGFQAFDITDQLETVEALKRSNDRFFHIANASSDAIWDQDLETSETYRSPHFCKLSGYSMEEIQSDINWWFNKIHPEDKERVQKKVADYMSGLHQTWEDEYRFLCADGSYKILYDKGSFLYREGKAVRIIGSITDITERRMLEEQLLNEKIKKERLINKTTIAAQEEERDNISKELHDNVNQLLMSTKLYINMARKQPANREELLGKAEEYQMMAVEEIRKLSKKLNSSLVKVLGLKKSIQEIVNSFRQLNEIPVVFEYDDTLENILFDEQKLMVFRIVQEQSNNIRKYANADRVNLSLKRKDDKIHLVISDDGIGFKLEEVRTKGIGLTNIANRVNVLNGEYKIDSYPGNGCTLYVTFPVYS